MLHKVFAPFVAESPVSVMFRGILENIWSAERLDRLFAATAVKQRVGDLLFSTCADLLSLVVLKTQKSVHAAYRARREEIAVSVRAVYDKLAGIETAVSEQLVRETARDLREVVERLGNPLPPPLPGFELRILDGNHLAGTEHRLRETRRLGAAVLPGQTLCVLDPQRQLVCDVVTCQNGHTSERTLIPAIVERVEAGQCWLADAFFCTIDFLAGTTQRGAYYLVRQHGQLQGRLQGLRQARGRSSTGEVFEQSLVVERRDGVTVACRRLTVVLDKPTQKGEAEVHLLTNLPAQVSAVVAAELYLERWQIEHCFQELTTVLRCEINTLGYPQAALFGFCLALVLFNMVSTLKAAIRAGAPGSEDQKQKLSTYYLADEIAGVSRGMQIAITAEYWEATFGRLKPRQLANLLKQLAQRVNILDFQTNPWTKKKPPPKKIRSSRGGHVATWELLLQRRKPAHQRRSKSKT